MLDPADDWGKIPSHLLDRGAFFSSPDPSEEGLLVDEEYDVENIWDRQEKEVQEDEKAQRDENTTEDFNAPGFDSEEIGPHVSLEEKCHGNPSKVSESMEEIRDKKTNSDKKYVEIKVIEVGDCELIKDEVSSSYIEDPIPPIFIANSKKGRRYSEDFKKEVREYSKTHSVRETMQFFDITKTSVQRWKLVKDEGPGNPRNKSEETLRKEKDLSQDQSSSSQIKVKISRTSRRKLERLNQREEVLNYIESQTHSVASTKFGIPVTTIHSWAAKRRQSLEMSRAVLEGVLEDVLATSGDHLESGITDHSQTVGKKKKREKEESSNESSIDAVKEFDYDHLSPAKRISKSPSQQNRPTKKKRKKI